MNLETIKRYALHPWTLLVCRLFTGLVFVVAATGKLENPVKFMGDVSNYQLAPNWSLPWIAAGMPGVEMIVALGLIVGWKVRANAIIINSMMALFVLVLMSAIFRGLELDCSCFDLLNNVNILGGKDPDAVTMVGWGTVGRDLILWLPCLPLLFHPDRKKT